MALKKERSSCGVVCTAREGGVQLWDVKGREVWIVRGVVVSLVDEESERVNDEVARFMRLD